MPPWLHAVENSDASRPIVRKIVKERLANVSPEMTKWIDRHLRGGRDRQRGLVLALEGAQPSVPQGLHSALVESCRRVGIRRAKWTNLAPDSMDDALQLLRRVAVEAKRIKIGPRTVHLLSRQDSWEE